MPNEFCPHCGESFHVSVGFCPTTGHRIGGAGGVPVGRPGALVATPFRVDVGEVIGLSVVTLGIYGIVRFYQVCKRYLAMAPDIPSNFEWMFWTWIAMEIVGVLTLGLGIGILFIIGSVVFGALLLSDILAVRDEALRLRDSSLDLTSTGAHVGLWVSGSLLSMILIGIPILVIQGVKFFQDNEKIVLGWPVLSATLPD